MWHLQGQAIDPDALGAQERRPWGPGIGCDLACQFLDSILIAQRFLVKLAFFMFVAGCLVLRFRGIKLPVWCFRDKHLVSEVSQPQLFVDVRMVLVSISFVDIFVWSSENLLTILIAVETDSRVLDFTSSPGGPQVFGEHTQSRGEALCLGVTGNILWPAG